MLYYEVLYYEQAGSSSSFGYFTGTGCNTAAAQAGSFAPYYNSTCGTVSFNGNFPNPGFWPLVSIGGLMGGYHFGNPSGCARNTSSGYGSSNIATDGLGGANYKIKIYHNGSGAYGGWYQCVKEYYVFVGCQ
jgi:hypothetical protein